MKFIKYKQVARITLYGFDDLYSNNNSSVFTDPLNSFRFLNNLDAGVQVGKNAKRMRFKIKGLDNIKLSENARFCIESINIPILYDADDDRKSVAQTIVRMANLSSLNCLILMEMDRQIQLYIHHRHTHINKDSVELLLALYIKIQRPPLFFIIHTLKFYIIFQYQVIF